MTARGVSFHPSPGGQFSAVVDKLLVGAVVLLAGFGVFSGNVLARTVGVIGATISALASFVAIALYPVWGICIIAVDIAVIWALTAHGRDVQRMREMSETGTG
jgi:hypothetical protein